MIQDIVQVFQEVLKQSGWFKVVQGLVTEHEGKIVEYRTKGEGDPIGRVYDLTEGVAYFRINEPVRIERDRDLDISSCSPYERRSWLLKVVCVARRSILAADNAYVEDKLAANVINLLSSENWRPLRTQLNAITVASRADRYEVGPQDGLKINTLELASVAVYLRVEVEASLRCFQSYGCGGGPVVTPVIEFAKAVRFTPSGGAYFGFVSVELSSLTDGALIYYTLDGSTPSSNSTLYTEPILITTSDPIRAIAVKAGLLPSAITSTAFAILPLEVSFIPVEGLYLGSVSVELVSNSAGGEIRFTLDGSDPDENSPLYSMPIFLDVITEVKAINFNPPSAPSPISTGLFQIKALTPRASVTSGTFIESVFVELFNDNPLGEIEYRINGGEWVTDFEFSADVTAVYEVRVVDPNYVTSDILTLNIEIQCIAPTIVPNGGVFEDSQEITLINNSSSQETQTRYTLDGTEPTESSTLYTAPFTITATSDVRAKNFRVGTTPSEVVEATFTLAVRAFVAVNTEGEVYLSTNKGASWTNIAPAALNYIGVASQEGATPIVAFSTTGIRRTVDLGLNWTTPTAPTGHSQFLRGALDNDNGICFASAGELPSERNVFLTTDGFETLTPVTIGGKTGSDFWMRCAIKGNTIVAVRGSLTSSDDLEVYISRDLGENWTLEYTEVNRRCFSVYISDDEQTLAIGIINTTDSPVTAAILLSNDNGDSFTSIEANYNYVTGNGDDVMYITNNSETIRRSTDRGDSFTEMSTNSLTGLPRSLACNLADDRLLIATSSRMYMSSDQGVTVLQIYPAGIVSRSWTEVIAV